MMGITETYECQIAQWNLWSAEGQNLPSDTTTQIYLEAIESLKRLHKRRLDILKPLTIALSRFNFTTLQQRAIYQVLSGAEFDSLQVKRLLDSRIPFEDFAEIWTLRFADEDLEQSKAELSTYGHFFKSIFCGFSQSSRIIDLREIPFEVKDEDYFTALFKWLTNKDSGIIESFEMNRETFESITGFLKGKIDLVGDSETLEFVKFYSRYIQDNDLEQLTSTSIDDAIICISKYQWQEVDLVKYKGEITDQQISQILSLRSLRRNGDVIDLTALFPRLHIIDASAWKSYFNMNDYGLNADRPIDMHAAIRNLYEMFRKLNKEANITLLTMPKGLTLNKVIALAQAMSIGSNIDTDAVEIYGDIPINKGYTAAITNDTIEETRRLEANMQKKLISDAGFVLPRLLEMLSFHLIRRLESPPKPPQVLGWDILWRVEETIDKYWNTRYLVVVDGCRVIHVWDRLYLDYEHCGVAAVRRF